MPNCTLIDPVRTITRLGSYEKLCIFHNTENPHCDPMSLNNFEFKSNSIILFFLPVTPTDWNANAQKSLRAALKNIPITKPAKNVIVFIGDGLGVSTVTAARILKGQLQGQRERRPVSALKSFPMWHYPK